jgi:hypothetical protein
MKILFRAYFHQKIFRKKLAKNLLGSGSGSGTVTRSETGSGTRTGSGSGFGTGSGRFRKSDPDPVKIRPDPQHWTINRGFGLWNGLTRVEEVDDGLALLHVARQPDVVELSGFFCLETDNVYIADLPLKN